MKPERHHRRIRRRSHLIHLLMLPVAVLAGFAWIYFALGACDADNAAALNACGYFSAIPFAPTAVGLLLLGFIAWDLVELGLDHHEAKHGRRPPRRIHHARHGYSSLDERHRRHVHLAAAHVALITAAVAGWLAWLAYRSTR